MRTVSILVACVGVLCGALPASAAFNAPPIGEREQTALHKVHGCHRSCEFGPVLGWHRHGPACRPVACVPRAAEPNRCFVDRFGYRHCKW